MRIFFGQEESILCRRHLWRDPNIKFSFVGDEDAAASPSKFFWGNFDYSTFGQIQSGLGEI